MSCYVYNDGDDLVVVIKDAKDIPNVSELVGQIVMASTGSNAEREDDTDLKPTSTPEPEVPDIDSDDGFRKAAEDFKAGRYNGPLRKIAAEKLNKYASSIRHQDPDTADLLVSMMDDADADRFLTNFDTIIPSGMKKAVSEKGYSSYEEFKEKADLDEKKNFILSFVS